MNYELVIILSRMTDEFHDLFPQKLKVQLTLINPIRMQKINTTVNNSSDKVQKQKENLTKLKIDRNPYSFRFAQIVKKLGLEKTKSQCQLKPKKLYPKYSCQFQQIQQNTNEGEDGDLSTSMQNNLNQSQKISFCSNSLKSIFKDNNQYQSQIAEERPILSTSPSMPQNLLQFPEESISSSISQKTIQQLNQFIDYLQNKNVNQSLLNKYYQQEMEKFPLENLLKQVQKTKRQKQFHFDIYNKFCLQQIETSNQLNQIEKQMNQYDQKIQEIMDNKKKKQKQISINMAIQETIQSKLKSIQQQYDQEVKKKNENRQQILKKRKDNLQKIQENEMKIKFFKQIKYKIVDLKQKIVNYKKIIIQSTKTNLQLTKDTARGYLTSQFTTNNLQKDTNIKILQYLIKALTKKQLIIKRIIQTSSQNAKFLANMKLQQKSHQKPLNLTQQSNQLTQQQLKYLNENKVQYNVYKQFLSNNLQIEKIQKILKIEYEDQLKKYNQIKQEVDNLKNIYKEETKKNQQLNHIEEIRNAEIVKLKKILEGIHQEIIEISQQSNDNQDEPSYFTILIDKFNRKSSPEKGEFTKSLFNF